MKKIISLIVALCMFLPVFALGETTDSFQAALADGKALVTQISFTPGKLPSDLASYQAIYADLFKTLGFKSVTQSASGAYYQGMDLLLGGDSVMSLGGLLKGDTLNLFSEILGDQPIAFSKEELVKLLDENITTQGDLQSEEAKAQVLKVIEGIFSGAAAPVFPDAGKQMDELLQIGTDVAAILFEYIPKAVVTQGDFKKDNADAGVMSMEITLSNQDLRDIWAKLGQTIQKNETLRGLNWSAGDEEMPSFEEAWKKSLDDMPLSLSTTINVVLDKKGALAFATLTILKDNVATGEMTLAKLTKSKATQYMLTVNAPEADAITGNFVLSAVIARDNSEANFEIQVENDNLVRIGVKTDAVDGKPMTKFDFKVESYLINQDATVKQLLVPQVSFGVSVAVTVDSQTQKQTDVTLLWEDKAVLTLNIAMSVADAQTLSETENAVHVTQLSQEELETFVGMLYLNAMTALQDAMTKLPESILVLFQGQM